MCKLCCSGTVQEMGERKKIFSFFVVFVCDKRRQYVFKCAISLIFFWSSYLYFFSQIYISFSHLFFFLGSSSALHLSLFPFSSSFRPLASLPSLLPRQDQSQISSRAGSYPSRFLRHLYPFFISFFYPINRHTSLHLSPFRLLPLSRRIGWRFCLRLLACNIFSYRV